MSVRNDPVIVRIEQAQAQFSHEALTKPQGTDGFAYGRAVGFYLGLAQARQIVEEYLTEDAERRLNM